MNGLFFTYVLTYGGAAAALFSPYLALLIYIAFGILKPESLWHWSVPAGNYSRIIAIALLVGWMLQGFGNWNFGKARLVVLALLGFWTWTIVSAFYAPQPELAWPMVESLSKTFLPFIVGITLLDSMAKLKQLAWTLILCQGYLAFEFNLTYFEGAFNPHQFEHGSLDNNGHAINMVAAVGMAFFLGLHADRWWQRWLAWAMAALMAHFVFFSMSRGGVLSLIVTGCLIFLIIPKQPRHYAFACLGLLLALRMAGPPVWERFATTFASAEERDESADGRVLYWQGCVAAMGDHPWVGLGPAHWPISTPAYGLQLGRSAHSTWLQVGAEFGVPAVVFLLLFYGICLVRLWPLRRDPDHQLPPWIPNLSQIGIVGIVGYILSAQFVTMYGVDMSYYMVLLSAGTLRVASQPSLASVCDDEPVELTCPAHYETGTV